MARPGFLGAEFRRWEQGGQTPAMTGMKRRPSSSIPLQLPHPMTAEVRRHILIAVSALFLAVGPVGAQ